MWCGRSERWGEAFEDTLAFFAVARQDERAWASRDARAPGAWTATGAPADHASPRCRTSTAPRGQISERRGRAWERERRPPSYTAAAAALGRRGRARSAPLSPVVDNTRVFFAMQIT